MHTEHLFRVHLYYWWALDFDVFIINRNVVVFAILMKNPALRFNAAAVARFSVIVA